MVAFGLDRIKELRRVSLMEDKNKVKLTATVTGSG
jgi:hypothetical protein